MFDLTKNMCSLFRGGGGGGGGGRQAQETLHHTHKVLILKVVSKHVKKANFGHVDMKLSKPC